MMFSATDVPLNNFCFLVTSTIQLISKFQAGVLRHVSFPDQFTNM